MKSYIQNQDKKIFEAIAGEEKRQREGLELIPSENYVSQAVLEANGSVFTNKYSEGYPGKRYYGGQDFTDAIELATIERACKLFSCKYANVQSHSGAPANLAVYAALLQPGDTILGMDLSHGGHLTHGHPVTFPAKIYSFVRYKVKDTTTGEIDYEALRESALKHKPKIILAGFSAYTRNLDYKKFVEIAKEVGAITMADMAHIAGLIAGGVLENPFDAGFDIITTTTHKTLRGPRGGMILTKDNEEIAKKIDKAVFPGLQGGPHMQSVCAKAVAFGEADTEDFKIYAQQILKNAKAMEEMFRENDVEMVYGGTDNHMLVVDVVKSFGIGGKEAQEKLDSIGITLNMNSIPDDSRSMLDPSGIRLGTPALTTRGFKEDGCKKVAGVMISFLREELSQKEAHEQIKALAETHILPEVFVS
ncbi:MAG: glycine hydroxymethyltransferase [Flavobacteriaceae bacterium]|jgi:glycine hydroxymethyltransferase